MPPEPETATDDTTDTETSPETTTTGSSDPPDTGSQSGTGGGEPGADVDGPDAVDRLTAALETYGGKLDQFIDRMGEWLSTLAPKPETTQEPSQEPESTSADPPADPIETTDQPVRKRGRRHRVYLGIKRPD